MFFGWVVSLHVIQRRSAAWSENRRRFKRAPRRPFQFKNRFSGYKTMRKTTYLEIPFIIRRRRPARYHTLLETVFAVPATGTCISVGASLKTLCLIVRVVSVDCFSCSFVQKTELFSIAMWGVGQTTLNSRILLTPLISEKRFPTIHFARLFRRHFSEINPNAIDQTWYKRAVDQYAVEPDSFVYSVPFSTGTGMRIGEANSIHNCIPPSIPPFLYCHLFQEYPTRV